MKQILVVDDEPRIAAICRDYLQRAGFAVTTAGNGADALTLARATPPDLVVLDLGLPRMDGLDVTRALRKHSNVPIIMLTAMGEQSQKVRGLELGADDYITKPFDPDELVARIKALLRRTQSSGGAETQHVVQAGGLTIDFLKRKVEYDGETIKLTPTEYKLLQQLAQQSGKVIPHSDLLSKVWGPEYRDETGYLWVYIRSLRQKLEKDPSNPQFILSEPGFGYRFQVPKEEA